MKKFLVIILTILAIIICIVLFFYKNIEVEYVPETEVNDIDLRKTTISLYYENKDTNEIQKESRLIDSKDLLLDPYEKLLRMLIDGPESDYLNKLIQDGTNINNVELNGDCLIIDFSKEFLGNSNLEENNLQKVCESIEKTMQELNEVNRVQILVEGEEI